MTRFPPRPPQLRPLRAGVRAALALGVMALALGLTPLAVRADSAHEQARAALLAGEILPLPTILERVAQHHPGNVIEIELEREHGQWIYELKILQSGGALLKLEVDARDATIIQRRKVKR